MSAPQALPAAPTPPGWYPCPFGNPGWLRWFDGHAWSAEHVRKRRQQQPPPRPRAATTIVVKRAGDPFYNLLLTIVTCGLWAPVWMVRSSDRYRVKRR
jgi:hypothetical protein